MTHPTLQSTTDATFDTDVLTSGTPVLVDFGAAWCGPCRMIAPVLQQVAVDEAHRLRVVTVDVDESPATARTYAIQGLPTLILFKDRQPVARLVGARPRNKIMAHLEPHLTA